jgi:hypothetical protein
MVFTWKWENLGILLFVFGGREKKDHESMIFCSLNNPQEKFNLKKTGN